MSHVTFERVRPDDYLVRFAASDFGRSYKDLAVRELAIRPGQVLVDLGCGPGTDLRTFAAATGVTGHVIGFDHDADAVGHAAHELKDQPAVSVHVGDIHAVDLADGSADRVHTDRVLQHVRDPQPVIAESVRILRPGGRAVFAEPDYDTLVIDYPDPAVMRGYRSFITDHVVRNATIGRELPRYAKDAGFHAVRTIAATSVFDDVTAADNVFGLQRVTERAVAAGHLDAHDAGRWLDALSTGPFFAAATIFVVIADLI